MKEQKPTQKVLSRGISMLISKGWYAISIALAAANSSLPILITIGSGNFAGVLSMPRIGQTIGNMSDRPLDTAIIIDTEDDVFSKFYVSCAECGSYLEVIDLSEEPEHGIILAATSCESCKQTAYERGATEGSKRKWSGF